MYLLYLLKKANSSRETLMIGVCTFNRKEKRTSHQFKELIMIMQ